MMTTTLKTGSVTSTLRSWLAEIRLAHPPRPPEARMSPIEVGKSYRTIIGETVTITENVGGDLPWKGRYQHDGATGCWTDKGRRKTYERSVHDLNMSVVEMPEPAHGTVTHAEPKDRLLAAIEKLEAMPNPTDPAISAVRELALALYHDRSAQNGEISRLKAQVADLKHQLHWLKKNL